MKVVITGGAGFLGRKLASALLQRGTLADRSGNQAAIEELVLFDMVEAQSTGDDRERIVTGDNSDPDQVCALLDSDTDSVFHLAAVVSAAAEEDFDLGTRVNLEGTRNVLEACRKLDAPPRVVFTSSIAVYGGQLPIVVVDETPLTPTTSYGTQKAMGELLVSDMSRKGFIDGRSVRLPTVTVRPGKPNRAASTWASSIVREPLQGDDVICPVSPESPMACMGPRRVIDALMTVHDVPADAFGASRSLLLSGISVPAGEMVAAMERQGRDAGLDLGSVIWEPDAHIQSIVDGWPKGSRGEKSESLGIRCDASFDDIVKAFIEDDVVLKPSA